MDTLSESDTSFNDSLNKSKKRSIRSDKWEKSRRKGNRTQGTDFRDRIARSSGGELATVFDIFGRILNMLSGLQEMMFATFVLNVKLRTDPNDNCKSSFHDHLEKIFTIENLSNGRTFSYQQCSRVTFYDIIS
ncbi:uncharacterized protein LOC143151611 isoform X3 [Ptiloglossa arizonensis]|uniref:uncharacterized protein LOC143151611 isoform X3 n=1 Tax=Ptiloglossa arizonensis TaxID=3350558 RepID=UPI003FA185D4